VFQDLNPTAIKTLLAEEFAAGIQYHENLIQITDGGQSHIVENGEITTDDEMAYIVSEYCPHGDVWDLLLAVEGGFDDEMSRGVFL
jgi:hypothetical protein